MSERDEKNRRLAEWLEVQHQYDSYEIRTGRTPTYCQLCHIAKQYGADAVQLPCRPDFYRSEEASALLLEKMPCATLYRNLATLHWVCNPSGFAGADHIDVEDPDRKTAIAEAALLLAERGGQ